jgi:steroid 5-alpha reductase family enzyme
MMEGFEGYWGLLQVVAAYIMLSFLAVWVIGLAIKDSSIVDIWFAPCLGIAAVIGWQIGGGTDDRRLLVMLLALLWSARLGGYLLWRNWGREDPRYARLRTHVESQGKSYAIHSLIRINIYQGVTVVILAVPFILAQVATEPAGLGAVARFGAVLVVFGVVFEGVADLQLARFKADAANKGKVLDTGLWRYSRHPNYFGECCVWLGFALIALEVPRGWIGLVAPALMAWLILGMMGKELLERRMLKKRPGYQDYVRRTSGFFPLPPQR